MLLNKPTLNSFLWGLKYNWVLSSREILLGFPSCIDKWQSSKTSILFPFYASWTQSDWHLLTLMIHGHLFLIAKMNTHQKKMKVFHFLLMRKELWILVHWMFFQIFLYTRTGLSSLSSYSNKQPNGVDFDCLLFSTDLVVHSSRLQCPNLDLGMLYIRPQELLLLPKPVQFYS